VNETVEQEQDRPLTRRDLVEQNFGALNQRRVDSVKISATAGGISFATALEVIEVAKLMAMSGAAVPKDFRGNAGMCLAVTMQAVEWRMSPFQVASKSYVVNDRLAFESQLIHAVIEARAPLSERLDCEYSGEGPTRRCRVIGHFLDGSRRDYETPEFKDIKVKNSPLWTADPDQQLWYYGSRAWSRKWCPDVIMGVYSRDELAEDPDAGREVPTAGLHARLVGGNVSREEGLRDGQVSEELKKVNGEPEQQQETTSGGPEAEAGITPDSSIEAVGLSGKTVKALEAAGVEKLADLLMKSEAEVRKIPGIAKATLHHIVVTVTKLGFALRSEEPSPADQAEREMTEPKNVAEWKVYCRAWLKAETSHQAIRKRWNDERGLRNGCGVTSEDRDPVQAEMVARCKELGE
jgi:RecT family protein/RNA polymerase alpha subunit